MNLSEYLRAADLKAAQVARRAGLSKFVVYGRVLAGGPVSITEAEGLAKALRTDFETIREILAETARRPGAKGAQGPRRKASAKGGGA